MFRSLKRFISLNSRTKTKSPPELGSCFLERLATPEVGTGSVILFDPDLVRLCLELRLLWTILTHAFQSLVFLGGDNSHKE